MSEVRSIHFFTIVLNGMPFIREQHRRLREVTGLWHWHIVEGVADLKHDTAWSIEGGGRVPAEVHRGGLSVDGTTEYLDELRGLDPSHVTIYRKGGGAFWEGKREMVQAPLANIREECLLWQLDADEFWTAGAIEAMRSAFADHPGRTAAWYWCRFFVGPDAVVTTRNCYAQSPQQDWLRTWRFRPGDQWESHEPPALVRPSEGDLGRLNPFDQNETEKLGAVFDHLAYVLATQLEFKERYYGYEGAGKGWRELQAAVQSGAPVRLGEFFPWVTDTTYARKSNVTAEGVLSGTTETPLAPERKPPMMLIDAVAFQDPWNPGICRVWESVLRHWVDTGFAKYVTVLDRGGTFPEIPGVNRLAFPRREDTSRGMDAFLLQEACDNTRAEVFVSTNYTSPISTPTVSIVYDFIPERLGSRMQGAFWQEKEFALRQASAYVCISQSTADDLLLLYPEARGRIVRAAPLGIGGGLHPRTAEEVDSFRARHGVRRPYFIIVGERIGLLGEESGGRGYKNAALFFKAFAASGLAASHDVVVVGGAREFEAELAALAPGVSPILVRLNDDDLAAAYSGAVCLVYSSKYEGFGLPVAEALCCGCAVITTRVSSLPEVAGEDAVYVDPDDPRELASALLAAAGGSASAAGRPDPVATRERFRWSLIADQMQEVAAMIAEVGPVGNSLWNELRRLQCLEENPRLLGRKRLLGLLPGFHQLARSTRPLRRMFVPGQGN
jgi:glycosyltransferase involved in cell wall biosynthesis